MGGDLEKGKALYASSQLVYCRLYRDSLFHFQMSLENCDDGMAKLHGDLRTGVATNVRYEEAILPIFRSQGLSWRRS
jgi:hypothetical protein